MHNCLVADVRLAGMLDTHPCFFSPFLFCLIGRCSQRWSPGAGDPRCRPPQHEDPRCRLRRRVPPLTKGSLEVPRQDASPFDRCCFFASLLKANLYSCVCTQILFLPLTFCSRAVVFVPSWPLL